MRIAQNVTELIGNTPLVRINRLTAGMDAQVVGKLEFQNPAHSVKDRIGMAMIDAAQAAGKIKADTIVLEPTSGNTGIGLAMVCAARGIKCAFVMPETMSRERRLLLKAYGADLILTPGPDGMTGAIRKTQELAAADSRYFIPQQFENPANIDIHRRTTAQEIVKDFPDGIDFLITGVGTGGHISGVAEVLKKTMPNLKALAVEPEKSQPIAGGTHTPHKLQGIGTGFIPANVNREVLDGTVAVSEEDAFRYALRAAKEEGIFVGVSSGAALAAVAKKLPEIPNGSKVLAFNYDTGERYLSVEGLFPTVPS